MKRRWRERTERLAAELLEVPQDTLEHVPRIVLIGFSQIVVENFRAIEEFSDSRIRLSLIRGRLSIRGKGLSIRSLVSEELVVEGAVHGVDFEQEGS